MMTAAVRTETWRGPLVALYPDGSRRTTERTVIIVTDIRDTILGPMDFGYTRLMPVREITIPPPA